MGTIRLLPSNDAAMSKILGYLPIKCVSSTESMTALTALYLKNSLHVVQ